jgi:predicted nucleotidyltransferase
VLSVSPERSVPPATLEVLRAVDRVTRELGVDYFVLGATARDIVLYGVFGIAPDRGTLDVDLAVAVRDWSHFEQVKAALVKTNEFTAERSTPHRLFRRNDGFKKAHPVDLLPFGGIEDASHKIIWPPELSIAMNVAGYREAFEAAQEVELAPRFVVRVASLPGLAILKLLAWADRGLEDPRDATDLVTIMRRYAEAGNEDRLYGEEIDLLETVEYNSDRASPRLLGKDAGRVITHATRDQVFALLGAEGVVQRLVKDMARAIRGVEDSISEAEALLAQFKSGLEEARR